MFRKGRTWGYFKCESPSLPSFHASFLLPSLSPSLPLSLCVSLVKTVRIHQQEELLTFEKSHCCVTAFFIQSVLVLYWFTDIAPCLIKDRFPNLCHILVYKIFCLSCSIYWVVQVTKNLFLILVCVNTINICYIILYSEALLTTGKALKIIKIDRNIIL